MTVSSRRKERMQGTVAVRWNALQPADARGHKLPGAVSASHAQDVRRVDYAPANSQLYRWSGRSAATR